MKNLSNLTRFFTAEIVSANFKLDTIYSSRMFSTIYINVIYKV